MNLNIQDLEKSSTYFLQDILYLNSGQSLLIYSDETSDEVLVGALQKSAKDIGVSADLIQLHTSSNLSYNEKVLENKIETQDYDSVCELSRQYFYPTSVWRKAKQKGCRVFGLGAIDATSFIRCIGQIDNKNLFEFGLLLKDILEKARRVQIRSKSGTDITCKMNSSVFMAKVLSKFKLTQRSKVWTPSGILKERASTTFMGGQIAFLGVPNTIEGTAVIDGYIWPPDEIGPLKNPIVLKIYKGCIVDIDDDNPKSRILSKWLNGKEKGIEHFCIGYNPGARLTGSLCEAERAFGHIVIGVGKYPFHTDGIIKHPELIVDNTVIIQNNSFVHDSLQVPSNNLCRSFHET